MTQPLSTVKVMTSVLLMNGMMIRMSSLVAGSKISFTSFFTTSSATFSGRTSPNISTKSLVRSGWPSFGGRYIIVRESPYAANENPAAGGAVGDGVWAWLVVRPANAIASTAIVQRMIFMFFCCPPKVVDLLAKSRTVPGRRPSFSRAHLVLYQTGAICGPNAGVVP